MNPGSCSPICPPPKKRYSPCWDPLPKLDGRENIVEWLNGWLLHSKYFYTHSPRVKGLFPPALLPLRFFRLHSLCSAFRKITQPSAIVPGSCSDAQGGALLKLQPGRHEEPQHRNGHRAKDDAQHQGLHGCGYADAAPHLQLLGVHGLNGLGHLRHGHHPSRGHRATQPIGVGSCHKGVAQEDGRQQAQGHGGEDTASHGFKLRTSTKQGIGLMGCALSLAADLSLLGWSVWSQDRRIQSKIKHKLGPIRIDPDWASLQEKKTDLWTSPSNDGALTNTRRV